MASLERTSGQVIKNWFLGMHNSELDSVQSPADLQGCMNSGSEPANPSQRQPCASKHARVYELKE